MWEKGETVIVYGGKNTSDGFSTRIVIGEVIEVGEDHLLVKYKPSGYFGYGRVSVVNKDICRQLEKDINVRNTISKNKIPDVGDLVNHFQLEYDGEFKVNEIGTVQAVEFCGSTIRVEIMVDGNMKSVGVDNCLILQRANKIPEKV